MSALRHSYVPAYARTPSPTFRRPTSRPMLVCYRDEWQVCYQARGKLDGKAVSAWVYGNDSIFFCEVGQQSHLVDLPEPDKRPHYGDQFLHTIEHLDSMGVRIQRLGGASNIVAANAMFQILRSHMSKIPGETVCLREASYVIRVFDCMTGQDAPKSRNASEDK